VLVASSKRDISTRKVASLVGYIKNQLPMKFTGDKTYQNEYEVAKVVCNSTCSFKSYVKEMELPHPDAAPGWTSFVNSVFSHSRPRIILQEDLLTVYLGNLKLFYIDAKKKHLSLGALVAGHIDITK